MDPLTKEDLRIALDPAVEAIAADFSDLRQELTARLDSIERRLERTENNSNALLLQTAGIAVRSRRQSASIASGLR
jgi:hypothetical protein